MICLTEFRWGPHTVDHFASFYNAQILRYNSIFRNSGTEAVDAFTQDWSHGNNWRCPPVSLIACVVRHSIACEGKGTLVVSEWLASYFWPFVNLLNGALKPTAKDCFSLPMINPLFIRRRG